MKEAQIFDLQRHAGLPRFNELDPSHFIWLPLASVAIDEHFPVNSMDQPVLRTFPLLTWDANGPLATDDQQYLRDLALTHDEMGYYLLHYQDIFGLIGVREYNHGWTRGRAVVFNGVWDRFNTKPTMLPLVYSKLFCPCKSLAYAPGKFSDYKEIYRETYQGPISLDD